MGLDTVEMILAIEDEFGVVFTDSDAAKMRTVGDIHSFILQVMREQGKTPDPDATWQRLRAIVVEQLGVRPEQVTPEARIVDDLGAD